MHLYNDLYIRRTDFHNMINSAERVFLTMSFASCRVVPERVNFLMQNIMFPIDLVDMVLYLLVILLINSETIKPKSNPAPALPTARAAAAPAPGRDGETIDLWKCSIRGRYGNIRIHMPYLIFGYLSPRVACYCLILCACYQEFKLIREIRRVPGRVMGRL